MKTSTSESGYVLMFVDEHEWIKESVGIMQYPRYYPTRNLTDATIYKNRKDAQDAIQFGCYQDKVKIKRVIFTKTIEVEGVI